MRLKLLSATLALLTGTVLLPGCGGDSPAAMATPPMQPQTQTLDTMQVLAIARAPSETSDPLPVAGSMLQLADPDDQTSDPVPLS